MEDGTRALLGLAIKPNNQELAGRESKRVVAIDGSRAADKIAVAASFIPVMTMYAVEAALIAEVFTPRLGYSGASIGYQLASIIAGGPAPFISTWLFQSYHATWPIGVYIAICAAIAIVCTMMLPDYTNKEIGDEVNYGKV